MKDVIVIGIAGGTGSGKSTLIQKIKDEFSNEITMLSHDFYYKQHNEIPFEERKKLNYDHPNSFDTDFDDRACAPFGDGAKYQQAGLRFYDP